MHRFSGQIRVRCGKVSFGRARAPAWDCKVSDATGTLRSVHVTVPGTFEGDDVARHALSQVCARDPAWAKLAEIADGRFVVRRSREVVLLRDQHDPALDGLWVKKVAKDPATG
jgi:hypothetical protein